MTFCFDKWDEKHPYGKLVSSIGDINDELSFVDIISDFIKIWRSSTGQYTNGYIKCCIYISVQRASALKGIN